MTLSDAPHAPVLADRIAGLLAAAPDGTIVDATLGAAGHAIATARAREAAGRTTRLVGIDRDGHALELAARRLDAAVPHLTRDLVRIRFDALGEALDDLGITDVSGVLLDLGISSMHVDDAHRGFSYRHDGPLDMRMDRSDGPTAADLVNTADPAALVRILREYGEERFADRITRAIIARRPITGTAELASVVRDAIPAATRRTGPHPATRTFQALRIAVNGELEALEAVLPVAVERLVPGGVLCVLAYHSLEDRIVKRTLADAARGCICPPDLPVCACGRAPLVEHLIRRPERPDEAEVAANPRARSALLRAARRTQEPM